MRTWTRADGKQTRTLARWSIGRSQVVAEWLPPKLYGRFHLHYGHDQVTGDRAVTLTVARFEIGWYR